jgi:vacuolar-type H+-ATPase catalytic subunit A/Vma1
MPRNREAYGLNGIAAQMPNAGAILEAQRTAAQNAARVAGVTCHYAMSWNRAWLNFWSQHLSQYSELPKRFADAQTNFVEQAFDHYQESIQELGSLASELQDEAEGVMKETQEAGERAVEDFRHEAKDMSKGNRLKEYKPAGDGERGPEHQHRRP